jgi:hypothetical protein
VENGQDLGHDRGRDLLRTIGAEVETGRGVHDGQVGRGRRS